MHPNQEWSKRHFASMKDGSVWGVPRSGLVFTRRGDVLVLTSQMPHDPAMPMTAEKLKEYQAIDLECIRREFALAGIEVKKADVSV
jgi:hypothetical protein